MNFEPPDPYLSPPPRIRQCHLEWRPVSAPPLNSSSETISRHMPDTPTRRVVITGMGLVSPLGNNQAAFWDALRNQRSGVAELKNLPIANLPTKFAAEARDFTGHIDNFGELDPNVKKSIRKGLKVMCREIQMGVAVAQMALHDSKLHPGSYDVDRTGAVYGCDYIMTLPDEFTAGVKACTDSDGFQFSRWAEMGLKKVDPLWLLKYLPNMPACHVAIYNDLRGPNNSITQREASANLAVAEAFTTIVRGGADIMLAGATGTRVHALRTVHIVLQEEIALDGDDPTRLSRPFDLNRTGLVLGEGAGAIVLEELGSARRRGVPIYAEVVGYGSSTVLDRQGIANCGRAIENSMVAALRSASMSPDQIGHVHAHGLSTRKSDEEEAQAIQRIFGPIESQPPVVAAKSYFGNLGAASGTVELISSILAVQNGELFPILNFETPDPACPVRPARAGMPPGDAFINVNVSPVGQGSAVVIRRMKP
jgi:3-oxoacyl-[acyl-carrier-protein] synthase II